MGKNLSKQRSRLYKVGKGRPPLTTRWKRGQSGNPSGRPKGSRNVSAILHDVIQQKVAVTENGRKRHIPALEVMLRRLANDAMQNDPRAIKLVLSLVDHAEAPEAGAPVEDLLADDQMILARYLHKRSGPATDPAEKSDDEAPDDNI